MRVEVTIGVEDYSTFSVEQTVINVIGNKDLWELVLMKEIFYVDNNSLILSN